jgi:phosphate transport system substrate-binding protein
MRPTPLATVLFGLLLVGVGYLGFHHYRGAGHGLTANAGARGAPAAGPSTDPAHTLRLTGSSSIGNSLAPRLARAWLQKQGARDIAVDDSQRGAERLRITATLHGVPIAVVIQWPGTATAFACLRRRECDVGMASRAIKDEEAQKLAALGDMTDPEHEHVLALDGIAIIVNRHNPVASLSLDAVARLFDGRDGDWSAQGGPPRPVHVYTRDSKSGTWDGFDAAVLHGGRLRADARVYDDAEALVAAVAADESGIGYVSLALMGRAKPVALREGDAQPLYPTVFTVATEDYPLARRLRLYTPTPASPLAQSFVAFALSDEGQAVVEAAGFVALSVRPQRAAVPSAAPPAYQHETRDAERLSLDFRFRSGRATLDARGVADLDRVVAFLSQPAQRDKRVSLFGFADNQGGDRLNVDLSERRAAVVSRELAGRGVTADRVLGFGSALPLASNDTPDGRERNRRVEIWIR